MVTTLISAKFITGGFTNIENQKVKESLGRLTDIYKFDLDTLSSKISDWSSWDDTYKFIVDKNEAYIQSNLVYSTLVNLKINYMIFVNNDGVMVENIGIDQNTKGRLDGIPTDLENLVATGSALITHPDETSEKSGLIILKEGVLMFVSRPIVTSNGRGPIRGALIFGKYLDDTEVKNLSNLTHLNVTSILVNGQLTGENLEAFNNLKSGNVEYVKPQSLSVIDGYVLLNDYFDKPAIMLKIEYPRDITNQGYKSVTYFIYGFILSGLVFMLVLEIFLSKVLLERIENLSKEVTKIGGSDSMNIRVEVGRENDEISTLAMRINEMLSRLSTSQQEIFKEREKVNTFFDVVSGIVVILSRGGKILSINKKGCEFLGITEDTATGKDWFSFIPENDRENQKNIFREIVEEGRVDKYLYLEHSVLNKDGVEYMFGWYNSVLRDQSGEIVATVSHGENVVRNNQT